MHRAHQYMGIDVGGTKVTLCVEGGGEDTYEVRFEWARTATVEEDLVELTGQIIALARQRTARITAVGVAMPATLERGRITTWPSRPTWTGLDLHDALNSALAGARVASADDGDVAAVAEAHHAGMRDMVYLGAGTGVGGGIIMDGRSMPGTDRGSCEIGHPIVAHGGRVCDCGRHGCLQAAASGPATLRRAAEAAGRAVTFGELRSAWESHTPWAVSAVDESCKSLAVAAIGLMELIRPARAQGDRDSSTRCHASRRLF